MLNMQFLPRPGQRLTSSSSNKPGSLSSRASKLRLPASFASGCGHMTGPWPANLHVFLQTPFPFCLGLCHVQEINSAYIKTPTDIIEFICYSDWPTFTNTEPEIVIFPFFPQKFMGTHCKKSRRVFLDNMKIKKLPPGLTIGLPVF